ncbi:MAG: leucine-rich repeat domain-containing protein [Oscillospiraceae bacterium]|nr:leucine-rich repeat domain-containing protein [Oscillospiraceae bacterium]
MFLGCKNFAEVAFSLNLRFDCICPGSFEGCSSLSEIKIPGSVKNLQPRFFKDCISFFEMQLHPAFCLLDQSVLEGVRSLAA